MSAIAENSASHPGATYNRRFTMADMDTIARLARRGTTVGDMALQLGGRFTRQEIAVVCDRNAILVRTA